MVDEQHRRAQLHKASAATQGRLRARLVLLARDTNELNRAPDPEGGDLSGSGVLVQLSDRRKGVLTADHCIHLTQREQHTTLLIPRASERGSVAPCLVLNSTIIRCRGGADPDVPDLAFLPLSSEQASWIEAQGGVFHRIDRRSPRASRAEPGQGVPCWTTLFAVGWLEDLMEKMPARSAVYLIESVKDLPVDEIQETGGWDYADHVFEDTGSFHARSVEALPHPGLPEPPQAARQFDPSETSRRGYSGGGLWRVWWVEGTDEYHLDLEGIIFYEWAKDENGVRRLRVHRQRSIAKILGIEPSDYSVFSGAWHEPVKED